MEYLALTEDIIARLSASINIRRQILKGYTVASFIQYLMVRDPCLCKSAGDLGTFKTQESSNHVTSNRLGHRTKLYKLNPLIIPKNVIDIQNQTATCHYPRNVVPHYWIIVSYGLTAANSPFSCSCTTHWCCKSKESDRDLDRDIPSSSVAGMQTPSTRRGQCVRSYTMPTASCWRKVPS